MRRANTNLFNEVSNSARGGHSVSGPVYVFDVHSVLTVAVCFSSSSFCLEIN